jgi:hypothetical protein
MFHVKPALEVQMIDPSLIFQRTQAGRDEIQQKSYGLTQSERLVLIMVDGASTTHAVRSKLPALADERFYRALGKLQKKELITEVLLPLAEQSPDELEPAIIDRFLQQDPMDPVTIILFDPEEYLDVPAEAPPPPVPKEILPSLPTEPLTAADVLDELNELAVMVEKEVRERPSMPPPKEPQKAFEIMPQSPEHHSSSESLGLHWGYWMIATGIAFILGYFFELLTR